MKGSEPIPREALETLARAIHERYASGRIDSEPGDSARVPWDQLPEYLQESNRRQAADIPAKLRAIGCRIVPIEHGPQDGFRLSETEVERLAELEHERWLEERREGGWTSAPTRDITGKSTPYLVAWRELPDEAQELDREPVRAIPELLALVGLTATRA